MAMKNFQVAVKSKTTKLEREPLNYSVGDDEQIAYMPTTDQVALVLASMGDDSNGADVMAAVFEFVKGTHDDTSYLYLRRRIADIDDPFTLKDLEEITFWMVEEKAARPTRPSGGSSSSPDETGKSSTGSSRRAASTRSRSTPEDSAT